MFDSIFHCNNIKHVREKGQIILHTNLKPFLYRFEIEDRH